MDENLNQLNHKLQLLIPKESKIFDFKKNQRITLRKIKRVLNYQKTIIDYLININNTDNYEDYLNNIKKMKKTGNLIGILLNRQRKLIKNKIKKKRNLIGILLNCHRKLIKNKMIELNNNFDYPIVQKKVSFKKLNSSIFETGQNLDLKKGVIKMKTLDFKSNNIYENINKNKKNQPKSKSLNPNFKNRNRLIRRTIVYNNNRNNSCKINIKRKRKRKSSFTNKDDLFSKLISGNL